MGGTAALIASTADRFNIKRLRIVSMVITICRIAAINAANRAVQRCDMASLDGFFDLPRTFNRYVYNASCAVKGAIRAPSIGKRFLFSTEGTKRSFGEITLLLGNAFAVRANIAHRLMNGIAYCADFAAALWHLSGQLCNAFCMQAEKRITSRPFRLGNLSAAKLGQGANRNANRISDLGLGQSGFLDFGDDFVPVHDVSFSNSRSLTLQQVEVQACDYSKKWESMSLAKRLKEAREDRGWSKAELKREAKLNSASTLTELENGAITESPQIPAIANALGVEVMWLKYGKGKKHPIPASQPASQPASH